MMKQRIFAMISALACMVGCMPTVAIAKDAEPEMLLYRVVEADENGMLIERPDVGGWDEVSICGVDWETVRETQGIPKANDLVRISQGEKVAEVSPECLHYSEEHPFIMENLGNMEEICTKEELYVCKENGYSYTLEDSDGNFYTYADTSARLVAVEAGMVLDFWVYEDYAVLPEPSGLYDTFFVVGVDDEDAPEHYVLQTPMGATYYVDRKELSEYMEEPIVFQCGDILHCYAKTYDTFVDMTSKLSISDVSDGRFVYAGSLYEKGVPMEFVVTMQRQTARDMHLTNDTGIYPYMVDYLKYEDGIWREVKYDYQQKGDVDMPSLREEDRVTMLTYEGYPVLPYIGDEAEKPLCSYIVAGVDNPEAPEQYILKSATDFSTFYLSHKTLTTLLGKAQKLSCGDILDVYIDHYSTAMEGTNELEFVTADGTDKQAVHAGSVYDAAEYAEFTVSAASKTANTIRLEKDGKNYPYNVDYLKYGICQRIPCSYVQDCAVDMASLRKGDKVTMLMHEGLPVFPQSADPLGDADGSGMLDILDVILVNRNILGAGELPAAKAAPGKLGQADFNGNGKIDADDSLGMLKRIVGIG